MIKIVIDAFGGDNSPQANIEGAIKALNENKDIFLIFTGDEENINAELSKFTYDKERVEVVHAPTVISCEDKPTEAIRFKKDSSLVVGMDLLRKREDVSALISNGSTGAVLVGAVLKVGRIKGVLRPAFCPLLPNVNGGFVGLCDSGANVDCDSENLKQFAIMGSLYLNKTYGVENPKIALLNIGVEEGKGDALRKETYDKLKALGNINFVGNMESRDLLSGNYDLIVCDGFSGNVLLKATEGACLELMKKIKGALTSSVKTKIGGLLIKKDIGKIKNMFDYNNYGGGVMLGTAKTVIKTHGSAKALSFYHCVKQAYDMEVNNLREAIENALGGE